MPENTPATPAFVPLKPPATQQLAPAPAAPDPALSMIHNIFGINVIVGAIKGLFSDPSAVNTTSDCIYQGLKKFLLDPEVRQSRTSFITSPEVKTLLSEIFADPNVKGALAEGVAAGLKRIFTDAESQKGIAVVGELIVQSQAATNTLNVAVEKLHSKNKELFNDPNIKKNLQALADQAVAGVQNNIDLSIQTMGENMKKSMANARLVATLDFTVPEPPKAEETEGKEPVNPPKKQ